MFSVSKGVLTTTQLPSVQFSSSTVDICPFFSAKSTNCHCSIIPVTVIVRVVCLVCKKAKLATDKNNQHYYLMNLTQYMYTE